MDGVCTMVVIIPFHAPFCVGTSVQRMSELRSSGWHVMFIFTIRERESEGRDYDAKNEKEKNIVVLVVALRCYCITLHIYQSMAVCCLLGWALSSSPLPFTQLQPLTPH